MMAGVMCCAICLGCVIAAGAGIAYGYNLSLAEYIDLKRSDITVYVRRGQFADKPDLSGQLFRRSGEGDGNEMFSSNYTVDYQDHKFRDDTRPLSDAWQKAQETRNYADKLTKYYKTRDNIVRSNSKDEDDFLDENTREDQKDGVEGVGLRRVNPIQQPKKKPNIKIDTDENSLYLKPNISKFLYSREDFEDPEESDIAHKPL